MKKKSVLITVCALGIIAFIILSLFITGVIPHMKYFTKELKNAVDDSNSAHYLIYKGKTYYKNDMLEYPYYPMYIEDYDKNNLKIIGWSGFRFHPFYYISYTDNDPIFIGGRRNFAVYLREDIDYKESVLQIEYSDVNFVFNDVFKPVDLRTTNFKDNKDTDEFSFIAGLADHPEICCSFTVKEFRNEWFLKKIESVKCLYELSPEFVAQLKECGVIDK